MKIKIRNMHYLTDSSYYDHVVNIHNMAELYPTRTETHHQLDKLNYHINHRLIPTEYALAPKPYDDGKSVVIFELDLLNDGRVYKVNEIVKEGIVSYAEVEELGV